MPSYLPNLLSALRLLCAAAFPFTGAGWRLAIVLVGGATDVLDGLIARRFGLSSPAGALLDAIADKLLVFTVLVTLAAEQRLAWWQVLLVLTRDLTVAGIAAHTAAHGRWRRFRDMVPQWTGKLATLLVFAWFMTLLAAPLAILEPATFWLTAAASVLAASDYLVRFLRALAMRR